MFFILSLSYRFFHDWIQVKIFGEEHFLRCVLCFPLHRVKSHTVAFFPPNIGAVN